MKETQKLNWSVRQICLSLGKQLLHWSHKKKTFFLSSPRRKKIKISIKSETKDANL